MGVLTRDEILKEMKKGRIKVEPFDASQVGPASIDLHLDNDFTKLVANKAIRLEEEIKGEVFEKASKRDKIVLAPNEFVLGITKERIYLPDDICGILTGRTRFARMGLAIHATAAFIQPGINNKQVLEIKNLSENTLVLPAGLKICQLVLMRTEGKARYEGKYSKQTDIHK